MTSDLRAVYQGVKFSCKFTFNGITQRWCALVYDKTISRLALSAIRNLQAEAISHVESNCLYSESEELLGSSTACVVILNRDANTIHTANIGDSRFVIVRNGKVVHKSEEQQHYFNAPYQLGVPPADHRNLVICDSRESADTSDFRVEDGDVILLATDGVFDNVPLKLLLTELTRLQDEKDVMQIQKVANKIALMARSLAFNEKFLSPFAKAAQKHGIGAAGGKPGDITVLLGTVAFS